MKKVFESKVNGFDEQAEIVTVFQLDSGEEEKQLYEMNEQELCDLLGVFDESGYEVAPGAVYHTYRFYLTGAFLIMNDIIALNV